MGKVSSVKMISQATNKARINTLVSDIQKIDNLLANGEVEELKNLHIELDGTYQNLIKNWGSSTYGYFQEYGYNYEYIDEESLRHNLHTMRGKLRGYLLQLSPELDEIVSINFQSVEAKSNIDEKASNISTKLSPRINMYDRIKERKFDVAKEYARIWKLFNTGDHIGPRVMSLMEEVDSCIQFFPDSFKKRALTLDDFNDIYGFNFKAPSDSITIDELISYCEYVVTLCDHLWEYADFSLEYEAEDLKEDLYSTIESCMDELGFVAAKKDNITIYVDKDPAVIAAAELVEDSLAYDVKAFIHKQSKGNLEKKKTILKFLADEIEPKRKILNANNLSGLGDLLFQMLQKFVRHNNDANVYIQNMSPEEIEKCYDDIYQLWLLATLEIDNIERKSKVKSLLGEINTSEKISCGKNR